MEALRESVRAELRDAATSLSAQLGIPVPELKGKLLRPMVTRAAAGRLFSEPEAQGALALQMVHEASILHDDILDGCGERRGEASLQAREGMAAALVHGDHLLTAAYRVAAAVGSLPLAQLFARVVERTVAGEKLQAASVDRWLSEAEYREIIAWKSGELFGCAAALPALVQGDLARAEGDFALGCRIGELYQRVDDFLDLCPSAALGKPALLDLTQGKWSWPMADAGVLEFPAPEDRASFRTGLFLPPAGGGDCAMRRALERWRLEADQLLLDWRGGHPQDALLPALVEGWYAQMASTLQREEPSPKPPSASEREMSQTPAGRNDETPGELDEEGATVRAQAMELGGAKGWEAYFAHHARSFRFSARLFPAEAERLVSGVYAFCRFTDDLVDNSPDTDPDLLARRLQRWGLLVRRAWSHSDTGVPLLDEVLGETRARGVSVLYAEELIRGVAMDLRPVTYGDIAALRGYSYRVASVVGLWLTELFGTREPTVLLRAEALGHAMQLTNILRDVGEDWGRGRLYLPLDAMAAHGVSEEALARGVQGGGLPAGWVDLMEGLLQQAEADYALAFEGIPALPPFFQRPVAVAARVYAGIHDEIRSAGYDTLTRRVWTGFPTKLRLGARGLLDLRQARRTSPFATKAGLLLAPAPGL